ncbi:MAG: hypothetical protein ACODAJ_11775 [Planctomycetota bacterium]
MGWFQRRGSGARKARPEFLRYGEALAALDIEEGRLRQLLAQGRLRGFRDDDSLKFLRSDVDALARRLPNRT